jgi:hypothetical protein
MIVSNTPLTNDQLRRCAPSIFAEQPYEKMSDKYSFIPTIQVLDGLRKEGFFPVYAGQSRTRSEEKRGYTKHVVRLRRAADLERSLSVGTQLPEVVLVNSHDGASAYQLMAGIYRLVCSNGMICGDTYDKVSVRHSGDVLDDCIDGCVRVVEDAETALERANSWRDIRLSTLEQSLLARAALGVRYGEDPAPITAEHLLLARRAPDLSDDLWTTTNRIQENLIRGGLRGRGSTGRRMTTRAIKSVSEDIRLNRAIMTLAEEFASLRASH